MPPVSLSSARILAVDDDAANLRVLRRLLQRAGCTHVETTSDPTAAEGLARAFNPHLVLLDLNMPVMDGFQVLEQLRERRPMPGVVVVSGEDADGASRRALDRGALAFVSKPYDPESLIEVVRRALGHAGHNGYDGIPDPATHG
jgi:putative two-component system response regulator